MYGSFIFELHTEQLQMALFASSPWWIFILTFFFDLLSFISCLNAVLFSSSFMLICLFILYFYNIDWNGMCFYEIIFEKKSKNNWILTAWYANSCSVQRQNISAVTISFDWHDKFYLVWKTLTCRRFDISKFL